MDEWRLLRQYVEENSQAAFAGLVERYINFVYSTCLREVQDPSLAEDVTQVVFLILARKAKRIRPDTLLSAWLYQTARFAAKNALTQEARRRDYEQQAAGEMMREMIHEMAPDKAVGWQELEPLLHEALDSLRPGERQVVLLRYFEERSLPETATALKISEDAARKRIDRALEKLRRYFSSHGFAVSSAVLATLLASNALQAAPSACVTATLQATSLTGLHTMTAEVVSAKVYSLWQGTMHAMFVHSVHKAIAIAILFVELGVGGAGAGKLADLAMANSPHQPHQVVQHKVVQRSRPGVLPTRKVPPSKVRLSSESIALSPAKIATKRIGAKAKSIAAKANTIGPPARHERHAPPLSPPLETIPVRPKHREPPILPASTVAEPRVADKAQRKLSLRATHRSPRPRTDRRHADRPHTDRPDTGTPRLAQHGTVAYQSSAITGCVPTPAGLIGWWPGDGSTQDIKGANDVVLFDGATFAPGKVGQAFSLDGVDDFVNVPDVAAAGPLTTAITVEGWIKPQVPSTTRDMFLFARRTPYNSESFSIDIRATGEILVILRTTNDPRPSGSEFRTVPVIRFGEWQHIGVTLDTSTRQVRVYLNGQEVAGNTIGTAILTGQLVGVDSLYIGRRQYIASEGQDMAGYYKGLIDELSVYNRPLTAAQIQSIYKAGSAGKCPIISRFVTKPRDSAPGRVRPDRRDAVTGRQLRPKNADKKRIMGLDYDSPGNSNDD